MPSGGTRPFGLTEIKRGADGASYRDVVPEEAEAIREAARDPLAGTPVKAIGRCWEAQGLRGTRGAWFSPQVVENILTKEWVVGRRAGRPARWPAILDAPFVMALEHLTGLGLAPDADCVVDHRRRHSTT